jgi:hypothetical protein
VDEHARALYRTLAIGGVAAILITLVRGPILAVNRRVKETSDVYALPPPRELVRLSLGYRSALADLVWAHVLVSQGFHTEQRRRYDNLVRLLDSINALDPTYRDPYLLTEALVTFQTSETPREEVLATRAILERGVKNCPLDAELWLALGQFVTYVAPGTYLTDPEEQARWRREGAEALERAAELSGSQSYIAWQAMSGARYLNRPGEIRFLEQLITLTDDPELKDKAQAKLDRLLAQKDEAEREWRDTARMQGELARAQLFHRLDEGVFAVRHGDLPSVARIEYMVLGPPRDPAYCAGDAHQREPACAPTWHDWEERTEAAREIPTP